MGKEDKEYTKEPSQPTGWTGGRHLKNANRKIVKASLRGLLLNHRSERRKRRKSEEKNSLKLVKVEKSSWERKWKGSAKRDLLLFNGERSRPLRKGRYGRKSVICRTGKCKYKVPLVVSEG